MLPAEPPLAEPRAEDAAAVPVCLLVAALDQPAPVADRLVALCDPVEHASVARFPSAARRRSRLVARGLLRVALAAHLGIPPGDVSLVRQGRPRLVGPRQLGFSLSHSSGLVLVAVTGRHDVQVGVDVEAVDPHLDLAAVARRTFTAAERAALAAAPDPAAAGAGIWTRKEAYLKARGTGWALPVAEHPDLADDRPTRVGGGRVLPLAVPRAHRAALAVLPRDPAGRVQPLVHPVTIGDLP